MTDSDATLRTGTRYCKGKCGGYKGRKKSKEENIYVNNRRCSSCFKYIPKKDLNKLRCPCCNRLTRGTKK